MKTIALLLVVSFAMSGCAVAQSTPQDTQPAVQSIGTITQTDLASAIASAKAAGDTVGQNCWQAISDWIGVQPVKPQITGAISGVEALRIANGRIKSGLPSAVHVNCAPVVIDAQNVMLQLGLIAATKALPIPLP